MAKFVCQVKAHVQHGRYYFDFREQGDAKVYVQNAANPFGDYRTVEVFAVINGARLEMGMYIENNQQWAALGSGETPSGISSDTRNEVLQRLGSWV